MNEMTYTEPERQSNGLGIASFVVSLVALVTCLLPLSPIGVILSCIAMFKRPRGFAIAGLILGLLGTLIVIVFVVIILAIGLSMAAAFVMVASMLGSNALTVYGSIDDHYENTGTLPASLDDLGLPSATLLDNHGVPFRYIQTEDGGAFWLISDGPDGLPDTSDDSWVWRRVEPDTGFELVIEGKNFMSIDTEPPTGNPPKAAPPAPDDSQVSDSLSDP